MLAYVRGGRFLIALNLTGEQRGLALEGRTGVVVLSARGAREATRPVAGELRLGADDAAIVALDRGAS